jgi:hypothetical protein
MSPLGRRIFRPGEAESAGAAADHGAATGKAFPEPAMGAAIVNLSAARASAGLFFNFGVWRFRGVIAFLGRFRRVVRMFRQEPPPPAAGAEAHPIAEELCHTVRQVVGTPLRLRRSALGTRCRHLHMVTPQKLTYKSYAMPHVLKYNCAASRKPSPCREAVPSAFLKGPPPACRGWPLFANRSTISCHSIALIRV